MKRHLAILTLALLSYETATAVTADESSQLQVPGCMFHQQQLKASKGKFGERPPAIGSFDSPTKPLTVHWPEGVEESYAKEILNYAEAVWDIEFDQMGFLPPHTDGDLGGSSNLDIYITTELDPGIGGYAGFSGFVDETPRQDAYGYLVINNNVDIRLRRFVVAHEMFHLSQMAYDWWEDISFMEASATWIPDHVFNDENIYWRYFPFFNQEPYTTLDFVSIKNPFQYGAGLFTQFIDERYGTGDGSFVRKIWEGSVQDDIDNEPDFLDALQSLLPPGTSIGDAYREFGVWRFLTGSRSKYGYFKEGTLWDERMDPWLEADLKLSALDTTGQGNELSSQKPIGPLAHAFLRVENDNASASGLTASFTGTNATFEVMHLAVTDDGVEKSYVGRIQGTTHLSVNVPNRIDILEHIFIVTNVTDGTYDADTSPWTGSLISYRFGAQ